MYELDLSVYSKTCEGKVDVSLGLRPESDTICNLTSIRDKNTSQWSAGCNYNQRRVFIVKTERSCEFCHFAHECCIEMRKWRIQVIL
jgi:hypothetical protein